MECWEVRVTHYSITPELQYRILHHSNTPIPVVTNLEL